MDLQKFWDQRQPLHRWSLPENELHKKQMGDLVEWIRVMASDQTWPRILDIGSGSGRLFQYLSRENIEADVTMIDFVDTAIKLCEENTGHKPDKWDGEVLPYEDNSFDLVVMMDLLLHVHPDKIVQVINEAKRVSNYYVYMNTVEWDQPEIKEDTWCFAHNFTPLFDGLLPTLHKKYEAKKDLTAYLFRVERKEQTLMEAIEEQIDDDFLQVEREDEGSTDGERTSSSDESSVSDDPEVG